jgi:ADP-heptose:LPS heptosyltransferase
MEVVEAAGRTEAPSWAGRLDVGGRAALVRDADRMVSGDTGIAHLATAARTPSVILFGPMPPALWGPPPERPMHRALHRAGRGDPHGTEVDPRQLAIEVDEVVEAARIGLAMRPARPPAQTAARLPSEGAEAS